MVAHDYGGAVSLRAHLLHGADYASLALVDVVALAPWGSEFFRLVAENTEVFSRLPPHIHEAAVRAYVRGASHTGLTAAQEDMLVAPWLGPRGRAAFYRQIAQADQRYTDEIEPRYGEISIPVKVVWGEEDTWIPVDRARRLAAVIPGSSLRLIGGAGHLIQLDAPVELATALHGWLASVALALGCGRRRLLEQGFDDHGDAVVDVGGGRRRRGGLDLGMCALHGVGAARPGQHRDVVGHVAEGDHVGGLETALGAPGRQAGGLVGVRGVEVEHPELAPVAHVEAAQVGPAHRLGHLLACEAGVVDLELDRLFDPVEDLLGGLDELPVATADQVFVGALADDAGAGLGGDDRPGSAAAITFAARRASGRSIERQMRIRASSGW
ncbi:hypothetical protein GCM10029992_46510 [Glycomyces albus]